MVLLTVCLIVVILSFTAGAYFAGRS